MIFDVNTAVGAWPFRNLRFAGNPKALFDHLAKKGITCGVTRHYGAPFCHDLDFINAELAKSVVPGFIPAFAVRPDYKQWKTLQAQAVALYPSFHNYKLTDPEAVEMVRDLASRVYRTKVGAILEPVLLIAALLVCSAYLVDGSFNPFLYFRF